MRKKSVLVKPVLQCEPNRVPGKILEAAAWEQVELILSNETLARDIIEQAKKIFRERQRSSEFDNQKEKIKIVESKIEALAERLTQLPKTVSAAPVFKQMEKLEALKRLFLPKAKILKFPGSRSLTNGDHGMT